MKPSKTPPAPIVNRRARFDYQLSDDLTVGLCLTGPQVRQIRDHSVQLQGSFITIKNGELWLNNLTLGSQISPNIKLLATKKQISQFLSQKQLGFTIIPTKLLSNRRHLKLVIALGKGKRKFDKRLTIKHRDLDRESRKLHS